MRILKSAVALMLTGCLLARASEEAASNKVAEVHSPTPTNAVELVTGDAEGFLVPGYGGTNQPMTTHLGILPKGQTNSNLITPGTARALEHMDSIPDARTELPGAAATRGVVAVVPLSPQRRLDLARRLREKHQSAEAEQMLVEMLDQASPDPVKQAALLELAAGAQDQGSSLCAQQVYAQFLTRWPDDPRVPEIHLRQGQLFRQCGLNTLALAKFYAVMTSALVLKDDKLHYYEQIVLSAQTEIAETHFQLGKYADAADFFTRLLNANNPSLDRAWVQFRLIRSLAALNNCDEVVAQAKDFVERYPDSSDLPEARFYLAQSLKQLGRNGEALQQVLTLLQEQKANSDKHPGVWAYWQQRAGNEIANQLYREADYTRALDIYVNLERMDTQVSWQLPVSYQIGLTYERLQQPEKALETYQGITKRESETGTNCTPGIKAVFEMARWRAGFLQWQAKAENYNTKLASSSVAVAPAAPVPATVPSKPGTPREFIAP